MNQNGVIAVVTIILGLIVKDSLETSFKPIFEGAPISSLLWLPLAQVLVFFLLILRFYLGSIRFGATEPKRVDFLVRTFNFVFSFLLFCCFYVTSLSVTKADFFYSEIIALHIIDALWFGLLFLLSHWKFVGEDRLQDKELRIAPMRRIMLIYLGFSLLTILYGWFCGNPQDAHAESAHWMFLAFLVALSGVDFWILREYYFSFEDWRQRHWVRIPNQ
jgi:hypothetical protein